MGGEWSCGSVLVAESWPAEHRAKAVGMMQSAWAIGALLAAGLSALILEPYGWRVLFLVGVFPAIFAWVIRRTGEEPRIWRETKPSAPAARWSAIFDRSLRRKTVLASVLAASTLIAYWGISTRLPAYLAPPQHDPGVGLTRTRSAPRMSVIQAGALAGCSAFGWVADRMGRRAAFPFFMVGARSVIPL